MCLRPTTIFRSETTEVFNNLRPLVCSFSMLSPLFVPVELHRAKALRIKPAELSRSSPEKAHIADWLAERGEFELPVPICDSETIVVCVVRGGEQGRRRAVGQ